jgi:crossover junction endodeoxyribonuclease RusA
MLHFRLEWPPTVNTYWKPTLKGGHGGIGMRLSERGRKYKEQAYLQLLEQKVGKGLAGRVEVLIDAYPPDRRKRDLDNICKPLLDVMEEYGIFLDDEQIDILIVRRRGKGGYVDVHVSEIAPEDSLTN